MVNLTNIEKGDSGKIISLQTDDKALKERLRSFGIKAGSNVKVKEFSPNKSTISVQVGKTVVALRSEEAVNIEVEVE